MRRSPSERQSPVSINPLQAISCASPSVPLRAGARQVVGLEPKRHVKALGELVVGALQQELAVGEPGGEAPSEGLRPPRRRRVCDRAMLLQPVEHQRAGALRCLGGAHGTQVAQPGEAVELAEPVVAGSLVTPGRFTALADLAGADPLAAELIVTGDHRFAAPGHPRHEIDRQV